MTCFMQSWTVRIQSQLAISRVVTRRFASIAAFILPSSLSTETKRNFEKKQLQLDNFSLAQEHRSYPFRLPKK